MLERFFISILFLILMPFLIIIAIIIFVFMGTPVIFKQKRIGKNQKLFTIFKFRTMDNEKITFLGRILRKLGIDELPQLFNIIKGEMSLVGPRPLTEYDIKRLRWDSNYYKNRWKVKPGITGMAQLSKICNVKISWFYDKYYVNHRSLCLNLKILTKSIFIPFLGKKKQTIK
ncbi:MAG: sugar transferase [Bacteroidales bacterium]|nr:sugar transferase [Bacteroidales bacterium]